MRVSGLKETVRNIFWIAGAWIIVALLISILSLVIFMGENSSSTWLDFFIFELVCISPWPLFTPLIIMLFRRFDFSKPKRIQSIFVHLVAILITFSVHTLVQANSVFWFFNEPFDVDYFKVDFVGFMDMRIAFYAGIILTVYTLDYYKKDRENSLREPLLRAELNRVKFHELKSQVPPQFLINTLDAVEQNIESQPELAEEIVADLSDLLRIMLDLTKSENVPLKADVRHMGLYLSVLNKRSGSCIEFESDIDPRCDTVFIPTVFYLIPFIEAIHQFNLSQGKSINKFIYSCQYRSGQMHLSAKMTNISISSRQLHEIQRKAGFHEIIKRLDLRYPSGYVLNCLLERDELQVLFNIPYDVSTSIHSGMSQKDHSYV